MKHLSPLLLVFSMLLFVSCEEIPPEITPIMDGGNIDVLIPPVEDQEKQVLLEKFTGVICVNCPAGSVVIENLIDTYNEQLIAVSIHTGVFSVPYDESLYDFRTTVGDDIHEYVGLPQGYPSAVVDRKLYEGEDELQLLASQWPGYVEEQIESVPVIRIGIGKNYDQETRELNIGIGINVDETLEVDEPHISVMIIEDDIIDLQLTPDGIVEEYKHKHVLRTMLTAFDGNLITEPMNAGSLIESFYTTTLPEEYVAINCSIIAFVNLGGDSQEVLQAHQVRIVE